MLNAAILQSVAKPASTVAGVYTFGGEDDTYMSAICPPYSRNFSSYQLSIVPDSPAAAPKVGNAQFVAAYKALGLQNATMRVVTGQDFMPLLLEGAK